MEAKNGFGDGVPGKLSSCRDCGGTVSKKARVCPHCGRPSPVLQKYAVNRARVRPINRFCFGFFWIVSALLVVLIVVGVAMDFVGESDSGGATEPALKGKARPATLVKTEGEWRCYQGPKRFISLALRGDDPKIALMLTQNSPQPIIGFFHNEPRVKNTKSLVAYSSSHGQSEFQLRSEPGHDILDTHVPEFLSYMKATRDLVFLIDGRKYSALNADYDRALAWLQTPARERTVVGRSENDYLKKRGSWRYYDARPRYAALALNRDSADSMNLTMRHSVAGGSFGLYRTLNEDCRVREVSLYSKAAGGQVNFTFECEDGSSVLPSREEELFAILREKKVISLSVDGRIYTAKNQGFAKAEKWVKAAP